MTQCTGKSSPLLIQSDDDHGHRQRKPYLEKEVIVAQLLRKIPDQGGSGLLLPPNLGLEQLEHQRLATRRCFDQQLREALEDNQDDPLRLFTFPEPSLLVFAGSILYTLGYADARMSLWNDAALDVIANEYRTMIKAFPKSQQVLEQLAYARDWVGYEKHGATDGKEAKSRWLLESCHDWAHKIALSEGNRVFQHTHDALKVSP